MRSAARRAGAASKAPEGQGEGCGGRRAAAQPGFACRKALAAYGALARGLGLSAAGWPQGAAAGGMWMGARSRPDLELLPGALPARGGLLWRPGAGSRPRGAGELPGALLRGVWGWWTTLGPGRGNWARGAAGAGQALLGPRAWPRRGGRPGRSCRRGRGGSALRWRSPRSRSLNEMWVGGCPRFVRANG